MPWWFIPVVAGGGGGGAAATGGGVSLGTLLFYGSAVVAGVAVGVFARTARFINSRPPHGLPPGEHRSEASRAASTMFRYDLNVVGTVNAFMS